MQSRLLFLAIAILFIVNTGAKAQYSKQDTTYKKHFVGSTLFMLGNLIPTNRPDFVQLNLGYRLSPKDALSIEFKTWKYAWPLGIPYGKSFESPEEEFPGFVREFGFALTYQRFLYKGLFTGVTVMNAWQSFIDDENEFVGRGFQIFNSYRVGYHFKLFNDRFFIQPSIAITHRPYHTKMPDSFKKIDDRWGKFLFGEPGMHFGYNF